MFEGQGRYGSSDMSKGKRNRDDCTLVAQTVKRLPAMRETRVRFLGREDPLEKEMAIQHSCLENPMDGGA